MKDRASQIYAAVRAGRLKEPFGPDDLRRACPGWGEGTYKAFLWKHRVGNPGKNTELFEQIGPSRFRTLARLQNSN